MMVAMNSMGHSVRDPMHALQCRRSYKTRPSCDFGHQPPFPRCELLTGEALGKPFGLRPHHDVAVLTSKMISVSTHTPSGRLATPTTARVEILSGPNKLTSRSDAASATLG